MRQVTHALLTRPPLSHKTYPSEDLKVKCFARLACVRHAASVHPEPGSNSRIKNLGLVFSDLTFVCAPHALSEVPHELRAAGASSLSWKAVCSEFRINLLANSFPLYCVWFCFDRSLSSKQSFSLRWLRQCSPAPPSENKFSTPPHCSRGLRSFEKFFSSKKFSRVVVYCSVIKVPVVLFKRQL